MTANVLLGEAKHDSAPDETGTQNVSYTGSHWSTYPPKLVFHLGTQCSSTQITANADLAFGFGNASEEANMSYFNEDGQSTTDTQYGIQNADVVTHIGDNAAITEAASISSLTAATVQLHWETVIDTGLTFGQLALGGDAIENISIDIIETPLANGQVSYTGPGFQPDALISLFGSTTSNVPYRVNGSFCGMGMSDGTTDVSSYQTSLNNQSTSNTASLMKDQFISLYKWNKNPQETATVVSLDSSGYTLDWSFTSGSTEREVVILAIKGPAVKVLRGTQPTSNSTVNRDAGFPPKAAIGFMSMKAASADSTDDSRLGVGFWSAQGDSQKSGGALDEDGQSTSDTDRYFSTTHGLKNYNHAQTVTGQATIGSSGDNLTETWSNTDGTEYAHAWMIFGDTPAASPAATSTGITSIISSGLSQLNTGNSLVSVAGAKGLGASGTLIAEITSTNVLDRTINEPGAPVGVLDNRFEERLDETSYYAGSGAYWGYSR